MPVLTKCERPGGVSFVWLRPTMPPHPPPPERGGGQTNTATRSRKPLNHDKQRKMHLRTNPPAVDGMDGKSTGGVWDSADGRHYLTKKLCSSFSLVLRKAEGRLLGSRLECDWHGFNGRR
ncbi:hypothetical protein ABEB36_015701 [Hypothenemus hampei]|uniref:Uncharacterized protein n=1 Tax=Hypothenemus hampei TaxID=57062 RepID=A0ABD1DZ46_HYPHA